MFDVVALGELLIDFSTTGYNESNYPVFSAHAGGAPANFLATLSRYGAKTSSIGKVGNDAFGNLLGSTLEHCGIDTSGLIYDKDIFTTLAFVTLDHEGNRSFSFARKPGADTQIYFEEINLELFKNTKLFHFGSLSLTHEPSRNTTYKAVEFAKLCGNLITFDPNLRLPLWDTPESAHSQILWGLRQADIVKISDDEVDFLFGKTPVDGAQYIINKFDTKLVFVTCGKDGAWFCNKSFCGHVACPSSIQAKDTTGAGDIFYGSAIWKLLQTGKHPSRLLFDELNEITRFACCAATLSTRIPGGISSIPRYFDVCEYL